MNNNTSKWKNLFQKYKHSWVFLYAFIYLPWFCWLEKTVTSNYYVIHSVFDDYIPFIEVFIIPYLLWFVYILGTMLYFFFTDKNDFYKLTGLLFTGMTIFLVISTLLPNGLNLRPTEFARDNIFVDMVKLLYSTDTSTNVLPSLHVFNSIGCYIAISHSRKLLQYKWIQRSALWLTISIVLSTMFLKQHSVIDVISGCVMAYLLYDLIYVRQKEKAVELAHQTV